MECAIEGCHLSVFCRGWCTKHYTRWQRHGDPLTTTRTPPMTADASEKHCPRCGNTKPIDQFGRRSRGGKPEGYCKACKVRYEDSYAVSPDGRENRRKARAKWNDGNHEYFIQYRYGIGAGDYKRMLAEQDGKCAICRCDAPTGGRVVWSVDHCHTTNRVRGLLCGKCNTGLGYFKDDVERLRSAIAYLDKNA